MSDWTQIGQNTNLFKIRFQYNLACRVLQSDLKKSRIGQIWGRSEPLYGQILTPMTRSYLSLDDPWPLVPALLASRSDLINVNGGWN